MPQFGLKGFHAAKYVNNNGAISYTNKMEIGDAINANLELRTAEGYLYANDVVAEYMRLVTGGSVSLGMKYIKDAAKSLLFGSSSKNRNVTYIPTASTTTTTATASSDVIGGNDSPNYVGVSFYAPDMRDRKKMFTCVFIRKCLFGPPSMTLQTLNRSITFQTPVTTGEFMADESSELGMIETAVVEDEAEAKAWVEAVLA